VRLDEIYMQYRDRVEFYLVYIQEIHPSDGWQVLSNVQDDVLFEQPETIDEKAEMAGVCLLNLNLKMPTLLDGMDNDVDLKYAALPERLFVLDAQGNVAWRSEMGPWGFDVDAWVAEIRRQASEN